MTALAAAGIFGGLSLMSVPVAAQTSGAAPLAIRESDPKLSWGPCPPIFKGKCEIAVLHGDPSLPNADIFLRVAGGTELTPHLHTSAERMVLVSGSLRVEYKGAKPTTLAVGDYAFGPARLPHRATCLGQKSCTLFIAFEGPVDAEPVPGKLQ
jgi:mannose-6-phosphate isomerase-like protein (cupin superfamily)